MQLIIASTGESRFIGPFGTEEEIELLSTSKPLSAQAARYMNKADEAQEECDKYHELALAHIHNNKAMRMYQRAALEWEQVRDHYNQLFALTYTS